jgi:hypothetical protein
VGARARLVAAGAVALGCVALAWALAWAGTTTVRAVVRLDGVRDAVDRAVPHNDLWVRLASGAARGGFVLLLVASLVAVAVLARRGRWRAAWALAAVIVGANGTVQAIKHGWLPFVPGAAAPSLSGHMPVVVGAAVAAVLLVPVGWRRRAAVWGAAVVTVAAGVVAVAWHTPFEVLVPTLIAAAWALVALSLAGERTTAAGAVGAHS